MKKLLILLLLLLIISYTGCTSSNTVMKTGTVSETVQLYCIDSDLYKLIPYDMTLESLTAQQSAEKIISELIYGTHSDKIKHLIPTVKNGVTVRVDGSTAYVNFSDEMIAAHPSDVDSEVLTVYSIVNSLCSLDAVDCVKFTLGGEVRESFKGFLDMRETFVPDYMV